MEHLKNEVADMSLLVAEKLLRRELATENKQRDLINALLTEIEAR
jgi:F0F1-type ATP synthase membrane subunit b/b'